MEFSRVGRAAVVLAAVPLLVGCGAFPLPPEDLPATFIPPVDPVDVDVQEYLAEAPSEAELATYRVEIEACGTAFEGTAFATGPHTLVTNHHVVDEATAFQSSVTLHGLTETIGGTVTGIATVGDFAIITTDTATLTHTLTLAEENPKPSDKVVVIGHPHGGPQRTNVGVVVEITSYAGYPGIPIIRSNADGEPGSSGSPVFGEDGTVVGVVYAIDGFGYELAMPVTTLRRVLDDPGLRRDLPEKCGK